MTIRYYAKRGDDLSGPFEDYSGALGKHVDVISRQAIPLEAAGEELQILLDVGSFAISSYQELARVLHHDPALMALFNLGREYEREHPRS